MYLGILEKWKNKKCSVFLKNGVKLSLGSIVDGYEGFVVYRSQEGIQDIATDYIATIVQAY